jgi:hypothetical protein
MIASIVFTDTTGTPQNRRGTCAIRAPLAYERRKPEETVLHDVIRRNFGVCLSKAQERSVHGFGWPLSAVNLRYT